MERTKEEMEVINRYAKALTTILRGYIEAKTCEGILDSMEAKYKKVNIGEMFGVPDICAITQKMITPVFYSLYKDFGMTPPEAKRLYKLMCDRCENMETDKMKMELIKAGYHLDEGEMDCDDCRH